MAYPPKISLYSLSDLKNTLDDHIPIYLTATPVSSSATPLPKPQRFTQSNTHTIIRLSLGYSAVAIAAVLFYQDYILKLEFADTKSLTFYACIAYFVLNSALTAWLWFGEKGVIFVGHRKGGKSSAETLSLRIHSLSPPKKYDPTYRLSATWTSGEGGREQGVADLAAPFTKFFARDGYFVPAEFEAWLRKELPVIAGGAGAAGRLQDAAAVSGRAAEAGADADDEDEETIVVGSPSKAQTATPGGTKKRTKRKS